MIDAAVVIRQSHITKIGNTIGSISISIYEEDLRSSICRISTLIILFPII